MALLYLESSTIFHSSNSLPTWYQIEFDVDEDTQLLLVKRQQQPISIHDNFHIQKLTTERPVVAWEENSRVEIK